MWGPLQNRVGAQIDSQIDQVVPKIFIFELMGVPFLGPDLLMHFAHPLAHFWYRFGTLWYLFGSNWLSSPSLWYHFHCFSLLLAPTFKPNAAPTSFWLFVSVCSARFQGCQYRYVLRASNSMFIFNKKKKHAPYVGVVG